MRKKQPNKKPCPWANFPDMFRRRPQVTLTRLPNEPGSSQNANAGNTTVDIPGPSSAVSNSVNTSPEAEEKTDVSSASEVCETLDEQRFQKRWNKEMEKHRTFRQINIQPLKKTNGEVFQGELMPLSLLTEDCWNLVAKLLSPLDYLSLCRTNSELDDIAGSKNKWLFAQVLPYLVKHFTAKSQFLKCRQVCKAWHEEVDNMLEIGYPCRRPYDKENPLNQVFSRRPTFLNSLRPLGLEFVSITPRNSQKFANFPQNSHALIGRALGVLIGNVWTAEKTEEFLNQVISFLEAHGSEIWHFKMVQYNLHLQLTRFYPLLCQFLNLLPNLKTLEIRCRLDILPNSDYSQIVPLIRNNPLPKLKSLDSLDIDILPAEMLKHLFAHFEPTLKRIATKLEFQKETVLPSKLVDVHLLHVHPYQEHILMQSLNNVATNLQRLSLAIRYSEEIYVQELLKAFRIYPNLTEFRISVQNQTTDSQHKSVDSSFWQTGHCQAPSVQYFEIEASGKKLFNFGALLWAFPNLKYLHFRDNIQPGYNTYSKDRRWSRNENVKLEIETYIRENALEESLIWDTLEDLHVITFESVNGSFKRFCNRAQVKWHRENKEMSKKL